LNLDHAIMITRTP